MTGFYDRVEGISKGFWEIGKKSGEFLYDMAEEAITDEDEFEGNGILDTVWGSWKDNVLGEGGVLQAAFGKDEIEEDGGYSATVGGNFFGSIPESIRKPGTKIISPVLSALDATYEYVVDRPIGTLITLQNMALTDPGSIIDPGSYAKAWEITNSRSMGQAFALAVGFVDPTDPDQVKKYKDTAWFNLLSGSIDMMGNIVLDPTNVLFAGTKVGKLARNAIRPGDYAAQVALTAPRYLKMRQRIDDLREEFPMSQQYKDGLGYMQEDVPFIQQLGSKIYKASRTGRLGKDLKMRMTEEFANNLAAVSNHKAFDTLIRMQMGDASAFEELRTAAIDAMNSKGEGGLRDQLADLTTPLIQSFKVSSVDGKPLNTQARLALLENNPFSGIDPNRAATIRGSEVITALEQMLPTEVWRVAEEALFNETSKVNRVTAENRDSNRAAKRLGLWFNPEEAARIDPLGPGIKNWFKAGDGSVTEAAFIRKYKKDLSLEQEKDLLAWAGIHPGDRAGIKDFWDRWDRIIDIDVRVDLDINRRVTAADALQGSVYRGGSSTDNARDNFSSYKQQAYDNRIEELNKLEDRALANWDTEKEISIYDLKVKGFTTRRSRSGSDAKVISGTPLGNSNFSKQRKSFWDEWKKQNKNQSSGDVFYPENITVNDSPVRNLPDSPAFEKAAEWEEYRNMLEATLPEELKQYIGKPINEIPNEIKDVIFEYNLERIEQKGFWDTWEELFSEKISENQKAANKIGKGKETDLQKQGLTSKEAKGEDSKELLLAEFNKRNAPKEAREYAGVPRDEIPLDIQNVIYELFVKENPKSLGQDAMPMKRNVSQGFAPQPKDRVEVFYGKFGRNKLSSNRTPEDGLAPYWEKFIRGVENNRKDVPKKFWDDWRDVRNKNISPVSSGYLNRLRKWEDIPDIDRTKIFEENKFDKVLEQTDAPGPQMMSNTAFLKDKAARAKQAKLDGATEIQINAIRQETIAGYRKEWAELYKSPDGKSGTLQEFTDEIRRKDFVEAWDGYIDFETDWASVRERRFKRDESSEVSIVTDRNIVEAEEILLASIDSRRASMVATQESGIRPAFEQAEIDGLVNYRTNLRSGPTKGKLNTVAKIKDALLVDRLNYFFRSTARLVKFNEQRNITNIYNGDDAAALFNKQGYEISNGWELEEGYIFKPGEIKTTKDSPAVEKGSQWKSKEAPKEKVNKETITPAGDGSRPKQAKQDKDPTDEAWSEFIKTEPFENAELGRQFNEYADGQFVPMEELVKLNESLKGNNVEVPILSDAYIDAKFKDGTKIDLMTDDAITVAQRELQNKIMQQGDNYELPFAAAFASDRLRLKSLARRADFREDAWEGINVLDDALNRNPDLVAAAADDILSTYGVGILNKNSVPKTSYLGDVGVKVVEYIEKGVGKGPKGIGGLPSTTVRLFSEKVVQGIIYWDDAAHAYSQFDKMLRDAGRVQNNGKTLLEEAGLNVDELLGRWASAPGTNFKKPIFYETVEKLNKSLVDLFGDQLSDGVRNTDDLDKITRILRRQWKGADKALKEAAHAQKKNYRAGQWRTVFAEGDNINVREMGGITPQQLAGADLVPRYDLYENLFAPKGAVSEAAKSLRNSLGVTVQAFTTVWKKAVLLRPAWPLRVLSDELLRTAAEIGTVNALKGAAAGFGDLRAGWYKRNGVDLSVPIQDAIIADFRLRRNGDKFVTPENYSDPIAYEDLPYGTLLQEYMNEIRKNSIPNGGTGNFIKGKEVDTHEVVQNLIKNVIQDDYRKSGITNLGRSGARTMGASAIGAFVAGPAGLAAGAIYGLYSRGSLIRLAKTEAVNHVARQLSGVSNARINTRIKQIEQKIVDNKLTLTNKPDELNKLVTEATDLTRARDMLETQANYVLDQHKLRDRITGKGRRADKKKALADTDKALDDMNQYQESGTLSQNFDTVGKMLSDVGVSDYHLDTYRLGNQFGNTAQEVGIYRNAVSANTYASSLWNSESAAQRATVRSLERKVYEFTEDNQQAFAAAWDDTVNRQWAPMGDTEAINVFQDFTRKFWQDDVTDADIISWLATGEGRLLEDAMPAHFSGAQFRVDEWVKEVRGETNGILPNIPAFKDLRARLARGEEIKWNRDVLPIVNRKLDGDIKAIQGMEEDTFSSFGKIVGDTSFEDAYKTQNLVMRVKNRIDEMFTAIGTMPTDSLTRSVVFKTIYQEEMAQRIQAYRGVKKNKDAEVYRLNQKQLNAIEGESRRFALQRTKNLLYDLSERTRFEEVMSNVMPFFAAYQEVMTRWAGLSVRNPAFVLNASRNFNLFLENYDAEDEDGNQMYVIRLGELFDGIDAKIPEGIPVLGGKDAFGKTAVLADFVLDFNFKSASMVSMGKPGFGPAFTIPVNETVLKTPSAAGIKEALFGKHSPEGDSAGARAIDSVFPTAASTLMSTLFNTKEKQRVKGMVMADLQVEYTLNGQVIETNSDWKDFEDEVDDRSNALLNIRMIANLGLPVQYVAKSAHYDIINSYETIMRRKPEKFESGTLSGAQAADAWILTNHPELWAVLGRQTRVATVASGTLEGNEMYEKDKKFILDNQAIGSFLTGGSGSTLDVQFEFNAATFRKELATGQREYQTVEEKYKRATATAGWWLRNKMMAPIFAEQEYLRVNGLPVSLSAVSNEALRNRKDLITGYVTAKFPSFQEEIDEFNSPTEKAEVIHSMTRFVKSDIQRGRPELPHMIAYLEKRNEIINTMANRARMFNDSNMRYLSHQKNKDLKELWEWQRIELSQVGDFTDFFTRFLENDDEITLASWPKARLSNVGLVET
tara:strand:- start:841 stop:9186 length:8346 start_codon:yes stop_codon:yes gene_type:complete